MCTFIEAAAGCEKKLPKAQGADFHITVFYQATAFTASLQRLFMRRVFCACTGVLYLLSCLAEFKDLRAELESADAVPMLLDLLATCTDTHIQVSSPAQLAACQHSCEPLAIAEGCQFRAWELFFEGQGVILN